MERLFEYLKRSFKIAYKSIFYNFKQYIFFFVALLIVQMFYGIMTISSYNNNVVENKSATDEYEYDVMLTHLNPTQWDQVKSYGGSNLTQDKYYTIVDETQYGDYYDISIVFNNEETAESDLQKFKETYYLEEEGTGILLDPVVARDNTFNFYESPRMQITTNIALNQAGYWTVSVILLALSIFLMTSLYNIRVNQYKFTYGVYMTYGADFKKLFNTAFWEMFLILCITFVPSVILSTIVVFLIYLPSGFPFAFNPMVFLMVFIFGLIVVLFSVFFPMRVMAIRQPMSLIVTQDNSNLVTSPKNSINVFKKKFPTKYELYSAWRFRKYSVNLLATAIVFCAFFIMGLYLADIYTTDLEYDRPDYKVNLENVFAYDEMMSEELYAIEGMRAVQVDENATEGIDIASHILVDKSDVKPFSASVVDYNGSDFSGDGDMKACGNVVYNAMNTEQIAMLDAFYDYKGDLTSIANEKTVIIGESISNISTFKYEVGDKIWVGIKESAGSVGANLTGTQLLREQIKKFTYRYEEFTIGAILTDIPSGEVPVFFSEADYELVTGKESGAMKLNIYVDQSLDSDGHKAFEEDLRNWGREYGDDSIENTYQVAKNNVAKDKHTNELYICISILLLGISPIMWFFSQGLYYMKRESEFNILQALGAKVSEIRSIYVQGGLIMAGLSLVVSFVLSFIGSYSLFYVYNVIMPTFSGENVRYAFYMPWYALVTSIVVSVACGFLSAYIPFKSYIKNRATLENGGAGGTED